MRLIKNATVASALFAAALAAQGADAQQMPAVRRAGGPVSREGAAVAAPAPAKVAKKLTSGGSSVYGYVGYDSYYENNDLRNTNLGALCNFGPNGYTVKWTDPMWIEEMSWMRTGYLNFDSKKNKYLLTGTVPVYYTGNPDIISVCYYSYDFETGKFEGAQYPSFETPYFLVAAYNSDDGYVYGLAEYLSSEGGRAFYGKAKLSNLSSIQEITPLDSNHAFISICWNCDDGYIYGILSDGRMMRVDKNGTTDMVARFDQSIGPWQTGLAYSPVEKLFYWNVNFEDGRSALYTIDINGANEGKGKYSYLYDFPNNEEFYFFVCSDRKADPQAPAVASVESINFPDGAVSGTVSFKMPTQLSDGSAIPSDARLQYQAMLDGSDYSGGYAAPGETVTLEFIDLAEEVHNFSLTSTYDGRPSLAAARELYIGIDTPLAPENVELTEERVAWEAVTEGVHGGWIDSQNMEYHVYVDGELMGKTKDYQLDITLPDGMPIHNFTASVLAVAGGKTSEPGISNEIVAGTALSLPVFFAPTADDAVTATYFDGNGDGNGWAYSQPAEAWVCLHSLSGEGDDWLFLPPVEIKDASRYYVLSFDSKIVNEVYTGEFMEVKAGQSRNTADMNITVKPRFTPGNDYTSYDALLKVDQPGVYYVGFHYISEEMQNGIYLKNVGIAADGLDASTPGYVSDVNAVPGEKGALEATLNFNMPASTIGGEALPASAMLTATVSAASEQTVSGAPGSAQSVKVTTVQGMNTVRIAVTEGEKTGLAAPVEVWTGLDIPSKVTNLVCEPTRDMMGVYLKWDAPVVGEHGGWVGDSFEYDIYRYMTSLLGPSWSAVASAGTDMEYLYQFEAGAPQDLYPFGVRPKNAAGGAAYVTMTAQMAGTPCPLPMDENFENYDGRDFTNAAWVEMNPTAAYTGSWSVTPISDYDSSLEGYLLVGSGARGSKAQMALPRVSTVSKDGSPVSLYLELYGGEDMTGMDILASSYDEPTAVKIGSVPANKNEGFYTATVEIPSQFLNKEWVALYFDVTFENGGNLMAVRRVLVTDPAAVGKVVEGRGVTVTAGVGELTVNGAEGELIEVFAADGRKVAAVTSASASENFRLPAGLYLVRGLKVIVR